MSDVGLQRVKELDLDQLRNQPEKLYLVTKQLRQTLLGILEAQNPDYQNRILPQGDPEVNPFYDASLISSRSSFQFWSGLLWVPAEQGYPTDNQNSSGLLCFGSSEIEVLVYDCTTKELKARRGLKSLSGTSD